MDAARDGTCSLPTQVLRELRSEGFANESNDDQSKGTLLMELLALEVQMYQETGNVKKVKDTYNAAMRIKNAIPHPRTMGVIRESGGKMHMAQSTSQCSHRKLGRSASRLFPSIPQLRRGWESAADSRAEVPRACAYAYRKRRESIRLPGNETVRVLAYAATVMTRTLSR